MKPFRKLFNWIWQIIIKMFAEKNFEQKYRDWLVNRFKFLNVRGIKTNAPVAIELEQVFISLKTKKPAERMAVSAIESKIEGIAAEFLGQEIFKRKEFIRRGEEYETEKTYELKDLFNIPQKRFIIIGAPGSGKTTLLSYLALKFARRNVKELVGFEDELLPIFINLRDTSKAGFLDVRKFTENYNTYIECPDTPPEDFFKKRLDEGKCVLLLDGLDEVASAEQRIKVAKWVDELTTVYPQNIFIATSRPYGYETAHLYNDFFELHILDFTPEQIEQFIRYWTKIVEIKARGEESEYTLKEAEREADKLLKAIKENPKIEFLTANPLLLTIIILVHRYRGHLPERRVELYDECCDVLLGYWDIAKGIAAELQPRQKRTVLQPLAFYLHQNGLREEKREKFIELLENELPKVAVPKDKAGDLLDDIKDRCGIVVETKLRYFGFTHPTFQEFLTARYILDNDLENFLVTKKRDKYWIEVTLLYCGMKDTTNLLQKILNEKEDIFHTNLFLAGRCLAESSSASTEMRTRITNELYNIYWNINEFNLSKETALEVLQEVKDQKIIQKFIEKTKAKESYVRWSAADALGQIKSEQAVSPLLELLKDKESDVRWSAAVALGQIKSDQAVSPLLELLKAKESYVRGSAADALGQIKSDQAVSPLLELLKAKESDVRWSAAVALGQIKSEQAVMPLLELLKAKESDVRWSAAVALGQIKSDQAVMPLLELLKAKESDVRGSAADALGQIGDKKAVESLKLLLNDTAYTIYGQVRKIAFKALKEISERTGTEIYRIE
ncbi:MAG: HEAT repeat domain-containing protein [candidate division Zixibacteria bacterium]|nr:HEAT repeat domain-containing protein [candidate division Zixibacteria bacterium]